MQLLTGPYCDNTLLPDGSVGNERPTALSEQECIDSYGSCQVANEAATQGAKSVCDTAGGVFTSAASYTAITDGEGNPLSDMQKYEMLSYLPPTSLPPTMITMMEQMMPDAVDEDSGSPTYGANLRGGRRCHSARSLSVRITILHMKENGLRKSDSAAPLVE